MDRVSFIMHVKDGYQDEYIRRHLDVWPDVMAEHERAGVRKMAIYMKGANLFLYMEVDDYTKAARLLSNNPTVLSWEEYMAPIMENSGDNSYDPLNPYPASLPEVYFWESSDQNVEMRKPRTDGSIPISVPHNNYPSRKSSLKS